MIQPRLVLFSAAGVAIFLGGLATGWKIYAPKPQPSETWKPAQKQADGSMILERRPMPEAEARKALPAPAIPKGARLERVSRVELLPRIQDSGEGLKTIAYPLRVDLALIRENDGRRVIASSLDGDIVGGLDIPVEASAPGPRDYRWAAGASYSVIAGTYGAWVQRNMGPFVAGVHANALRLERGGQSVDVSVSFGIRW